MPTASIQEGERLAKVYCQSCHLLPDPALLDAKSWEKGVLPAMGPRLGIFNHGFERYHSVQWDANLGKSFYPSTPLLSQDDWQHILDYYSATSPDSLAGQPRPEPIGKGLPLFEARTPAIRYDKPATTLVKVDTSGLFVFDIHYQRLYRWSSSLELRDSIRVEGGIVDMIRQDSGWVLCNIGMLNPNNGKFGKLELLRKDQAADTVTLVSELQRPVQVQAADLNGDGRTDYLVCEFGHLVGALSWLEDMGTSGRMVAGGMGAGTGGTGGVAGGTGARAGGVAPVRYRRHVLRATPGAIRAYINDYNHDGLPDIWVLFAQGDEGIVLFTNKGKGQFEQRSVLRFPPSYGSSYFELADFNKDGHPDIVYTCGDNADFSPVLKPYHGVYIFMNDGADNFRQDYFFPINGCYKAMARDFDGDGDLDLATISFFPDLDHQPEEGFVYLENVGGGAAGGKRFRPFSLPETQRGKWLTMDAGDVDGDGRIDIVLGNFSFYAPVTKAGVNFSTEAPFMVLKNMGVRPR